MGTRVNKIKNLVGNTSYYRDQVTLELDKGKVVVTEVAGLKCKLVTSLTELPRDARIVSTLANFWGSGIVIGMDSKYYVIKDGEISQKPL